MTTRESGHSMTYSIEANALMEPWLEGLPLDGSHPLPARLRQVMAAGITERVGGLYFTSELLPEDRITGELGRMSTSELEAFMNRLRIDSLKPVQRTVPGSNAWVYECLAISVTLGRAVLDACATVSATVVEAAVALEIGDDYEQPTCTFRFSSSPDGLLTDPEDFEQAVFVMRLGLA